jgi:hypothetical protein
VNNSREWHKTVNKQANKQTYIYFFLFMLCNTRFIYIKYQSILFSVSLHFKVLEQNVDTSSTGHWNFTLHIFLKSNILMYSNTVIEYEFLTSLISFNSRLDLELSLLRDKEIGHTEGVAGQQRMLTPPWHLILPSYLSGSVLPHTWFGICLLDYDYVWHIVTSLFCIV